MKSTTRRPRGAASRALLVSAVALFALAIAASAPAGAPRYAEWTAPVNLGPPVNSAGREIGPALSEDGLSLYFDSTAAGGSGARDLWVSHRPTLSAAWQAPVNLGSTINSSADDYGPAFSPDGHRMFFNSARAGGLGSNDIYQSYREDVHNDLGWQAPTTLGPNVNSDQNDNGPSYFENIGGAPQLFFGSGPRPGGLGERDLYVSDRQADGSWGPATLIPELSSVFIDTRPTVRRDGLEIFFHRGRPLGATDVWVATRDSVHDHWSAPTMLDAVVNGSFGTNVGQEFPYLSADGRTLFFDSNRPGFGSFDLYMTTRAAELTVTANDQTRLFGAANPSLTYGFTGFVGGETSSVVSGSAVCSTTATRSSPAGAYAITCTVGSLTAPGYVFDSFVAGTLTVRYSSPCLTGVRAGSLHVAAGEAACIGAGGSQVGPVTVEPGASLDVEGGTITGPVVAGDASAVRVCGATIIGPLTISGSTGPVIVGGAGCDPNTVIGPVRVTDNTGGVEIFGNRVIGPLRVTGNAAPVHATGNTVTGPATIQP